MLTGEEYENMGSSHCPACGKETSETVVIGSFGAKMYYCAECDIKWI